MESRQEAYEANTLWLNEVHAKNAAKKTIKLSGSLFNIDQLFEFKHRRKRLIWDKDGYDLAAEVLRRQAPALEVGGADASRL